MTVVNNFCNLNFKPLQYIRTKVYISLTGLMFSIMEGNLTTGGGKNKKQLLMMLLLAFANSNMYTTKNLTKQQSKIMQ